MGLVHVKRVLNHVDKAPFHRDKPVRWKNNQHSLIGKLDINKPLYGILATAGMGKFKRTKFNLNSI